MAIKTTTNTVKNQKIRRKMQKDSVEAIKIIRFSLQILIYETLNIFSIQRGFGNNVKRLYDFRSNQNYEN